MTKGRGTPMRLVFDPWSAGAMELEADRSLHQNFADVRNLLGLLYLERGQAESALSEFEAALSVNPEFLQARFNRLVALRRRDGSLDSELWKKEALVSQSAEPVATLWRVWYLAQCDDRSGVERVLAKLAEEERWVGLAWFVRAVYADLWKDAPTSSDALARSARAHPLYREILESRGWLLAGEPVRGALRVLPEGEDPSAWNPAAATLHEFLGTLCARYGSTTEAVALYEESFLRQGEESRHLVRLARLEIARGDEDQAVRVLCRAIMVDPTSVEARVALGFEYQSQGYHDEALVQFEVAARLRPHYPDLQYNLGLLYEAKGRDEDALRCLRRAIEIHPSYFQARTSLAGLLLRREEYALALRELEPVVAQGIRSADLLVQTAEAHLALDQVPEAVQALERAASFNPNYPRTFYVLGEAHRRQGLKRKAQEAWQQYLEHSRRWQENQPVVKGEASDA